MFIRSPYQPTEVLPWEKEAEFVFSDEELPTLSIVIPIYNSGRYLEKTLRSILCNNLAGVEILLMDGGSTDNTMDIVCHYEDMFSVIRSRPDKGQSDAINQGFLEATGTILYWLNGDDILLPGALDAVRKHFKSHKDCQVLVGDACMTDLDFHITSRHIFSPEKLTFTYLLDYAHNHLIQPSVFFSAEAWDTVGPLNIDDHYAMDADLFLGMAKQYTFEYMDKELAYSRYHPECKTQKYRLESLHDLALVQAKYGGIKEARSTLRIAQDLYAERIKSAKPVGTEQMEYALSAANHSRTAQVQLLTNTLQKIQHLLHEERLQQSHMHSTLSWKITTPLRYIGHVLSVRKIVYIFFKACKDLWVDFGRPFPRLIHFVRYTIFGHWKPYMHTEGISEAPKNTTNIAIVYDQNTNVLPTVQSVITQSLPFTRIVVLYTKNNVDITTCKQKFPFIDFYDMQKFSSLNNAIQHVVPEKKTANLCLIPNAILLHADALRLLCVFLQHHNSVSSCTLPTHAQQNIHALNMPVSHISTNSLPLPVCIRAKSLSLLSSA